MRRHAGFLHINHYFKKKNYFVHHLIEFRKFRHTQQHACILISIYAKLSPDFIYWDQENFGSIRAPDRY